MHEHEWTGGNPNLRRCHCGEMQMLIQGRWERVYMSGNPFMAARTTVNTSSLAESVDTVTKPAPTPEPPQPKQWKRRRRLMLDAKTAG
jgi:hypothetical protein